MPRDALSSHACRECLSEYKATPRAATALSLSFPMPFCRTSFRARMHPAGEGRKRPGNKDARHATQRDATRMGFAVRCGVCRGQMQVGVWQARCRRGGKVRPHVLPQQQAATPQHQRLRRSSGFTSRFYGAARDAV